MLERWQHFIRTRFGNGGAHGHRALPLANQPFVVLDTETTGLNPQRDRILSLGIVPVRDARIRVRECREWFLAQEVFDGESVPIHGILREGPNARLPEREVLEGLRERLEGTIVVGHHVAFDRAMLQAAYARWELPPPDQPFVDTEALYRHTLIKSPLLRRKERYTLDDLASRYGISCKDRHTALGDAQITAYALLHILEALKSKGVRDTAQLLKLGGLRG